MSKKPTVLSLLMEIKNLLEGKAVVVAPIPQPRVINDRFTDNGDGTITDKENKTLIVKDPSKIPGFDKTLTFKEAKEVCESLSYAGYNNGWRMPTLKEEQSIRDYAKYDPAWNTDVFGGKHDNWYWTSTPCAWNTDEEKRSLTEGSAWCVGSSYGNVGYDGKDLHRYVRPVRSCQ
jgi:hypothetical protein